MIGVILFAFTLRSGVAGTAPLIDFIQRDLTLPASFLTVIGSIPPVCFAVAGLLTAVSSQYLNMEHLMVLAMILASVGIISRALSGDSSSLLFATVTLFIAVGVGNVLLPPIVKKYFPDRIAFMTTVYTTVMAVGTLAPPIFSMQVAEKFGWRLSIGMWAVLSAAAVVPGTVLAAGARRPRTRKNDRCPMYVYLFRMSQLSIVWGLVAVFTVAATLAYVAFNWLPSLLISTAGATPGSASSLLALYAGIGLPLALAMPLIARRAMIARLSCLFAAITGFIAIAGLIVNPGAAPILWVCLLALTGLLFPLSLTLLALSARTHLGAAALSAFVQGLGYTTAAVLIVVFGVLHELFDGWVVALILLIFVVAAAVPASLVVTRSTTVEEEWERHHGPW